MRHWDKNKENETSSDKLSRDVKSVVFVEDYVKEENLGVPIEHFVDCLNALEKIVYEGAEQMGLGNIEYECYEPFNMIDLEGELDLLTLQDRVRYPLTVMDMILNSNPWGLEFSEIDETIKKGLSIFTEGCDEKVS